MKARLAIALSFFLLPALLLFVNNSGRANGNPRPHAAHGCSTKTTVGRYFVICNGFLSPGPNAPLLPAKLLGTLLLQRIARMPSELGYESAVIKGGIFEFLWREVIHETLSGGSVEVMRGMIARRALNLGA